MHRGLAMQAKRAYEAAGMLFTLHLDVLHQCDLDCVHCYLDDKRRPILPTAFWIDVLDQAAALGVFSVILSGGEALLRHDLLDLVAHARRRGLFVHLKSHGGHIDRDVARRLAAAGVSTVTLSYFATEPAIHDAITRRPGSHARTRAALQHLAEAGVMTIASCLVMQDNRDAWPAVIAECEGLGVEVVIDRTLQSALSGDPFPHTHALPLADAVEVERRLLVHAPDDCAVAPSSTDPEWGERKSCTAGHSSLYVSPAGDVMPCVMWPLPLGNLARGERLDALWRGAPDTPGPLDHIRATRRRDRAVCSGCEVREHCAFCAGQAFVQAGDPDAAVTTFCLQTRARTLARAAALGLPDPPLPAGLVDRHPPRDTPPRPRFTVRAAPRS